MSNKVQLDSKQTNKGIWKKVALVIHNTLKMGITQMSARRIENQSMAQSSKRKVLSDAEE